MSLLVQYIFCTFYRHQSVTPRLYLTTGLVLLELPMIMLLAFYFLMLALCSVAVLITSHVYSSILPSRIYAVFYGSFFLPNTEIFFFF